MLSRGEARALWVGILIAVPSGAGVALSVLGGNAGSLGKKIRDCPLRGKAIRRIFQKALNRLF